MLSNIDILQKIKSKDIIVSYSFFPDNQGTYQYHHKSSDANENDSKAFDFLKQGLIRNRIKLTTGGLIMPLLSQPVLKKHMYANYKHIVDLRRCVGGYKLSPGKSALIFSNEWIKLDKNHSAVIVSGVGNYKRGLVIASTLVDSQWQGILKMLVTNLSDQPQRISIGDDIGRMFFFECGKESREDNILADTASHYRYSWQKIFTHEIDPFGYHVSFSDKINIRQKLREFNELSGKWIGISSILILIYVLGFIFNFYTRYQEVVSLSGSVKKHERNVNILLESIAYSGLHSITFKRGESAVEVEIPLRKVSKLNPGFLLFEKDEADKAIIINGEIVKKTDGYFIHFIAQKDSPAEQIESIKVRWAIIP